MNWNTVLTGLIEKMTSVKFFVILISSVFFYFGTLNQDGWVTMVLTTTGMRVMNEIAAMYKDIRVASAPGNKAGP